MRNAKSEGLGALDLEAACAMDAAVCLARVRGHVSLSSLLRYEGIPYGIGRRVIESMAADGLIEPTGEPEFVWRWAATSAPGFVARMGGE